MIKKANVIIIFVTCFLLVAVGIGTFYLANHNVAVFAANNNKNFKLVDIRDTNTKLYTNEDIALGIADPFVLKASDGKYYLYGTSSSTGYKVWSSTDMIDWREEGMAYSFSENSWSSKNYWAPEVVEKDKKFYMYYSAQSDTLNSMRIGVAVSDSPVGPFTDVTIKPLFDLGYAAIDPDVLLDDDGKAYLYFSRDCSENVLENRHESHIYGVELNSDLVSLKGEPKLLVKPEQNWETVSGDYRWNEAPTMVKHNGTYYLMYSGNYFDSPSYAVGYATSDSPLGAFTKYDRNPILTADVYPKEVSGTGHNSVVYNKDTNEMFMVYHEHSDPKKGKGDRKLAIDRMGFRADGSIYVNGPSIEEQPYPYLGSENKNIALEASVKISSTADGYSSKAVNDGEISVSDKNERYEWAADGSDANPTIEMTWPSKKKVDSILIYGSSLYGRKDISMDVILDGKNTIKNVTLSKINGKPAVLAFNEQEISSVKIAIKGINDNTDIGLSEVVVMGK